MENHKFFIERWESEMNAFGKVLRAVPEGKLDYKPHERSTSAGALAWQLAEEQRSLVELLDNGRIDWATRPFPEKASDIVEAWDKATNDLRSRLATLDTAKAESKAAFAMGGQTVWEEPVGHMLWGMLFDMVHHRGQLSTYLRPMGSKVPAIYGPSADENA